MALQVAVEDENGNAIFRWADMNDVLPSLLPELGASGVRCLCFVDPYGNTVFNRYQAREVIKECHLLLDAARSDEERQALQQLQQMAQRVDAEPHLYLKFYGD